MSNAIRPPMGNSLSPEPCALFPLDIVPIHLQTAPAAFGIWMAANAAGSEAT
jgi:hypothetical protein